MRSKAREIVFQLVFGYIFTNAQDEETKETMKFDVNNGLNDEDRKFVDKEYYGVIEHFEELKDAVKKYSQGFALERVYKTDLALLLLGIYEIKYEKDIPHKVTCDEVIGLAHSFGTEKSYSFINGILASVIKEGENNDN